MKTPLNLFERKLAESLDSINRLVEAEESDAGEEAKKKGLTHMGYGRYGKDGQVTHKSVDGKLQAVQAQDTQKTTAPTTTPTQPKPTATPTVKKTLRTWPKPKKQVPLALPKPPKPPAAAGAAKPPTQPKPQTPAKPSAPQKKAHPVFKRKPEAPTPRKRDPLHHVQKVMPKATLSGKPLSQVPPEQLKQVSMQIDKLAQLGADAKARGEKAPNYNLCQITIPGTNLYCGGNKGIPRAEMPQFKGKPVPGSPADRLPKDDKGEVDTEEFFKSMLSQQGVRISDPVSVPPDRLKATQSELVGTKVAGMSKALEDPNNPAYKHITAPIYVSHDGYVLDGHHRWAAIVSHNAAHPEKQIPMQVRVIDRDIVPLVQASNKFAEKMGIRAKAADTGAKGS